MTEPAFGLSTSISLIRRAKTLDSEAWGSLVQLYGPLIYSWARRSGLQSDDAADVLQNVFVSVWRGLPGFAADRPDSSFRGWLRTITRNAVREWLRRRDTAIQAGALVDSLAVYPDFSAIASDDESHDDGLFGNLTGQALKVVRASVDQRTWDAFWRIVVEDVPAADVAASSGLTVTAVRQAKYRVLCRLRELLLDR